MPDTLAKLVCSGCGKSFAFKPEYAGRSFRCKCGSVIKAPAAASAATARPRAVAVAASAGPPAKQAVVASSKPTPAHATASAGEDDFARLVAEAEYDLTPPAPPPLPRHTVRAAPAAVMAAPVPAAGTRASTPRSPMLAYAGTVRKPAVDAGTEAAKITDLWAPLILIAVGLIAYFVDGWFFHKLRNPVTASIFVVIESAINLALVFIALLIGIKLIDLGLGPIGPALMKIAAVALLPDALGDVIYYTTHIPYAAWIATLFMYWGLLSYLFDMDFGEVVIVTGILWVVQTWISMFLIALLLGALGIHLPSAALPVAGGSGNGGMVSPAGGDSEPEQTLDAGAQDSTYSDLVDGGVEARNWLAAENVHHIGGKMNRAAMLGWAENFYTAGAKKVWVVHIQKVPPDELSREFVIELPDDPESRKKIFFFHDNLQHEIEKTTDKGTKYLHITVD